MAPKHLAIIPDGNRRWAQQHNLPSFEGHRKGYEAFKDIVPKVFDAGVDYFSFWAMSEDNFKKRNPLEVKILMELLSQGMKELIKDEYIRKNRVSFECIGNFRNLFPEDVVREIDETESALNAGGSKHLQLFLAYDGGTEMMEGVKSLVKAGVTENEMSREVIHRHLWTHRLPAVDLIIRTGGEPHNSAGFMMWLTQNSQLYFTENLWPDFGEADLKAALTDYASRERRFGK